MLDWIKFENDITKKVAGLKSDLMQKLHEEQVKQLIRTTAKDMILKALLNKGNKVVNPTSSGVNSIIDIDSDEETFVPPKANDLIM